MECWNVQRRIRNDITFFGIMSLCHSRYCHGFGRLKGWAFSFFLYHSQIATMGPIAPNLNGMWILNTLTLIQLTQRKKDQCALDANGNLQDASEIEWHYDKDSEIPMNRTGMLAFNHILNSFFLNISICRPRTSCSRYCPNGWDNRSWIFGWHWPWL